MSQHNDSPPSPRAARIAAQGADTSRRFGVGFVPVYPNAPADRQPALPVGSAGVTDQRTTVTQTKPTNAPSHTQDVMRTATPATNTRRTNQPAKEPTMVPTKVQTQVQTQKTADKQARLDEILARYTSDAPHKGFNTNFTNIVFGEGNPNADLLFVGEAPGADEDAQGRPFVGRSGTLLDKMIAAMGLSRQDVYIANVLKTRPIDNATPTSEQARKCSPYLYDQIRVIEPKAIVTLGLPAAKLLLGKDQTMGNLRGTWWTFCDDRPGHEPTEYPVMPTYHPAFLLRNHTPEVRAKVWSDLLQAMEKIGLANPTA